MASGNRIFVKLGLCGFDTTDTDHSRSVIFNQSATRTFKIGNT